MNNYDLVKQVENMVEEVKRGSFKPLLEADVVGFLYHLLISKAKVSVAELHLDTRVRGARKNDKLDIVIGDISTENIRRPVIVPRMVIEVKVFPIGFDAQQHRVHYEHVLNDDLPKLQRISQRKPDTAVVELLYDECPYLDGKYKTQNRIDYLLSMRDKIAQSAKVIVAKKKDKKADDWRVLLH
nr:hypothetical protein [candidate division Zixibacteria bacterium]